MSDQTNPALVTVASGPTDLDAYAVMESQYSPAEGERRAIGVMTGNEPLALVPIADRYPISRGAASTIAYVSGVLRLALLGYRLQFVDLLSELLEGDPHCRSTCSTRIKAVAGRPWDIVPADVEHGDKEGERKAKIIADYVKAAIKRIPQWKSHVAGIMWAVISGVAAREIMWERKQDGEHIITGLRIVHSRRLGYDWDWNLVWSDYGQSSTGNPLRNYPGKFLVFEPSTWDEYQTREGIGRTLVWFMSFKRFDVRDFVQFVERFGKPYPKVKWQTGKSKEEAADEKDIATAKKLAKDIGRGSLAGVAYPDTIELDVIGNGSSSTGAGGSGENTPHKALVAFCDEQNSKLVLGQAYTTNAGQKTGLGNSGDVFADASQLIFVDDAGQIAEAIDRDIIWWIVALNFGKDNADRYCPHYQIEIEDPEDADKVAERIEGLAKAGVPVPTKYVFERMQWPEPESGDEVLESTTGSTGVYVAPEDREQEPEEPEPPEPGKAPPDGSTAPPKPAKGKPAKVAAEDGESDAPTGETGKGASPAGKKKSAPRPKKGVAGIKKDGGTPKRDGAIQIVLPPITQAELEAMAAEARVICGLPDTKRPDEGTES